MTVKAESYWYWLKATAKASFTGYAWDWSGIGGMVYEAMGEVAEAICRTVLRILLLLTLPISAPFLAWYCMKVNASVAEETERRKREVLDQLQNLGQGIRK